VFVINYVSDHIVCSECCPLADTQAFSRMHKSIPLAVDFSNKATAAARPSARELFGVNSTATLIICNSKNGSNHKKWAPSSNSPELVHV